MNNQEMLENIKEQHNNNYLKAIQELVKKNTQILIDEDILSLIKKPPLDSMDNIRGKLIEVSKRNKIILDDEKYNNIMEIYRKEIMKKFKKSIIIREKKLLESIEKQTYEKEEGIFKLLKKDFIEINKIIKKDVKEILKKSTEECIIIKLETLITADDKAKEAKIIKEVSKFINNNYQKQILESVEIKLIVKDTTLINGIKEIGERFIFTKNNSYLLK